MRLDQLIAASNLSRAITDGLVKVRESDDGQRIFNYGDAAMWTPGAWDNPAVRQCRGLIVDGSDEIVARPWAKFFNHGQAEAGDLDISAPVEVTDKLDGSLGILHRDASGNPRVASRGSFQSEQAVHATHVLRTRYADLEWSSADITPLVEIVYPANRIVCDYGDLDDLVLLGGVGVESGTYYGPEFTREWLGWRGPVAATFPFTTLRDALAAPPRAGKEGLCVRYLDRPHIVKIKQEDYVALHRIVTGLSERTVWEHVTAGAHVTDVLDGIPDELHPWVRGVWARIQGDAKAIRTEAARVDAAIRAALPDGWTRKDYAIAAQGHPDVRAYLFNILDGRDPSAAILKTLRPAGDTRFKPITEDVA